MSAAELSRFDELVSRYLDDTLADADAAELVALLAESSMAARFLETTRLNSEIAGLLAAPVPDAAMVELVRADIEKHLASAQPVGGVRLRIVEWEEAAHALIEKSPSSPPRPSPSGGGSERIPSLDEPSTLVSPKRGRRFSLSLGERAGVRGGRALAWAAGFLVFAGLAAFFLFNRGQTADAPVIVSVQGEVRLVEPKGERVLTRGDSWRRDEKLRTVGTSSAATLKFHDGSQLDFGDNTVAVNESSRDGLRVQLDHGTVQAALKPQPARRPFVLATPEAEAVVVGTTLRLITDGHRTRLEVTEGEVRFRRLHDGAEIAVKAGHYAVVAPNAPFGATPFHPDPHAVH